MNSITRKITLAYLALALASLASPVLSQSPQLPTLNGPTPSAAPPSVPITTPPPATRPTAAPPTGPPRPSNNVPSSAPPTPSSSTSPSQTTSPAMGSGSLSTPPSGSAGSTGPSDADVLMFAYNLECLEGQFYSCAAFGTPLNTSITGNGPAPSSCTKANLSSSVGSYAAELAREEAAHVEYLFSALQSAGGNPVCPQVNIDTAFEAAAEAAFGQAGTPLNPVFNPYANDAFFLHGSFIFEDLGVSAYLGGQSLLQNTAFRQAAGQIGNAESYHSGLLRTLLYQILNTTPAYGRTVQQITGAIVAVLNQLSGQPQLRYALVNDQGASIANVNSQGLVPVASPAQVLKVVTLGASSGNGGGFFPANLVGNVKN